MRARGNWPFLPKKFGQKDILFILMDGMDEWEGLIGTITFLMGTEDICIIILGISIPQRKAGQDKGSAAKKERRKKVEILKREEVTDPGRPLMQEGGFLMKTKIYVCIHSSREDKWKTSTCRFPGINNQKEVGKGKVM